MFVYRVFFMFTTNLYTFLRFRTNIMIFVFGFDMIKLYGKSDSRTVFRCSNSYLLLLHFVRKSVEDHPYVLLGVTSP